MKALAASLLVGLAIAPATRAQASSTLEPYQVVRSLQLVQDRIANGDHAALPMQRLMLDMADERFRTAAPEEFAEPRNRSALFVYAMSGGNPTTFAQSLAKLPVDDALRPLGDAIVAYLGGDAPAAYAAFAALPPAEDGEHAPLVALVRGTVLAAEQPARALADLDGARLAAPGTLVEEAALRRTLDIAVATDDAAIFTRTASSYVRRFLRSPYANQFADTLVDGIAKLHDTLDAAEIGDVLSWMTQEQSETVALRLARQAAIANDAPMNAFAAALASPPARNPRALLYANLPAVASSQVSETLSVLKTIDPDELSSGDRALLDAAKDIAQEVVRPVSAITAEPSPSPAAPDETENYISDTRARLEAIDRMLEGQN